MNLKLIINEDNKRIFANEIVHTKDGQYIVNLNNISNHKKISKEASKGIVTIKINITLEEYFANLDCNEDHKLLNFTLHNENYNSEVLGSDNCNV